MLDKIKDSVSDVLSGGEGGSDDGPQTRTVADKRARAKSADGSGDGNGAVADEPESNLYECPSCEAVFVAIDKETCASCQTSVERIE
ncbi:hypothetical protein Harman_01960 [Haloarcula mannanilytica]|uniref:Uncharacterized protein n=1 Tax=Haloarcula mannanilytica TaxID=2509225 RepID=A0A4C2ECL1_9EURY|nr:hypothetical protein [Haloarcula mannanilytica]GCF12261.1 hypothetical protein Harman_01960 [Haloarcula mannanilytica]